MTLEQRLRRATDAVPPRDVEACDLLADAAQAMRDASDFLDRVERKYPPPSPGAN